jgi:RNase P subunit RPR2
MKGMKMGKKIVCPNCKKTISENPIIEEAAKGTGSDTQSITCECGERITYWRITAQLRDQKTMGFRFKNWIQHLTRSQS